MGQLIIVDEDEYYNLKFKAQWYDILIQKIDSLTDTLYPNILYWIAVGRNIDVALVQVQTMADEIKKRRRPFWRKPKPKVEV